MGDAPPQESVRVGQIRETWHLIVLSGLFPSLPTKKAAEPNLVISMEFLAALTRWGGPLGVRDGWCATPGGLRGRKNQKAITFFGLKGAVPLFTHGRNGWAKSPYLGGIFDSFVALRRAPVVTDGWCAIPGGSRGRTNQKEFTFERFMGAVFVVPTKKTWAKSGYLSVIFGRFGAMWGAPGVTDGWCATLGGCQGRTNQKDFIFDGV